MNAIMETDEQTNERSLVLRAQQGDREAFGLLAQRYEGIVYATAYRRLNNHAEAQELSQEVMIKLLERVGQLRQPECFAGWLRSITTRLAINRVVRRQPAVATEPHALESTCIDDDTPLTSALANERSRQVRAGLRRLGELDRQTLVAFYVDGESLLQMSDRFDSPVGTIKRRLHVARKRLAKELGEMVTA